MPKFTLRQAFDEECLLCGKRGVPVAPLCANHFVEFCVRPEVMKLYRSGCKLQGEQLMLMIIDWANQKRLSRFKVIDGGKDGVELSRRKKKA